MRRSLRLVRVSCVLPIKALKSSFVAAAIVVSAAGVHAQDLDAGAPLADIHGVATTSQLADLATAAQSVSTAQTLSASAVYVQGMEAILSPRIATRSTNSQTVRSGDTVETVLKRAGAPRDQVGQAVYAMRDLFDGRSLRVGQNITAFLDGDEEDASLVGFALEPDKARTVYVWQSETGEFTAREMEVPTTKRLAVAKGEISTSLYVDALAQGASPQLVANIANLLAYSVDFQREIYPGDPFEIMFEEFVTPDGDQVRTGEIHYVRFAPQQRRNLEYWRFTTEDGQVGFYDAVGESAKRFLMKTPINGARLSSNFGRRRHPVLGYTRMHKGTDFAAPRGTPIYAAGDGVVERANRFGSYGNYIRIRHANGYKTAYAHLDRFHSRARNGRRVSQGEVIGYVGTTGRSTGPHLHYEVLRNGSHINPMSMRAPTGRKLSDAERENFVVERQIIDSLRLEADPLTTATNAPAEPGPSDLAARTAPGPDPFGQG